jgi:mannonate dehydratase
MKMTFRWFGQHDPVRLEYIRQIPGVTGIVSSIYDIAVGEAWTVDRILALKEEINRTGLSLEVIESVPVHEDIKLGKPARDQYIENYRITLENLSKAGIHTVCYNFMPVFDWFRSRLDHPLEDGSTTLTYEHEVVAGSEPFDEEFNFADFELAGWDSSYESGELQALLSEYTELGEEGLWDSLTYFLHGIIDTAHEADVKLGMHPDDPPWTIFGLPRIMTEENDLDRLLDLADNPSNGLTFCTGSLGAKRDNDLPGMIRRFGNRIHFAHCRNIKWVGEKSFQESAHLSSEGSLDMVEILRAYADVGYSGPMRPDHGRMIWGETGRPGYGLYDRALGATYLSGIWEALNNQRS